MKGHLGGLGTWIAVWGQFGVRCGPCPQERRGKSWSTPSTLPSFLAFASAQPFCLPSLAPWLCPAPCTSSLWLSLQPTPCRSPLCSVLPCKAPTSDGGRAHPAPPCLRPQLLVSPGFARSVPGYVGGGGATALGEGSHLGITFVSPSFWGHATLPAPEGHEVLGWVVPPVLSVLVSPRNTPHLHLKQG